MMLLLSRQWRDQPRPATSVMPNFTSRSPSPTGVSRRHRHNRNLGIIVVRAIHLSRLHWCDAVPRLAGWCPVPAFAGRVPVMVRHGRGLLGLSGVAALAGRVRLPAM